MERAVFAHTEMGDGMNNSIWTNDVRFPEFPRLDEDLKTDVLIVGGGLAGIFCAWKLQQDGVDYALIEADRICHGVTRNTTAKVTAQHGLIYEKLIRKFGLETARAYWDANSQALEYIRSLSEKIPCDFEVKDNFIYSTGVRKKLDDEMAALKRLGISATLETNLPLPVQGTGAVRVPKQGQFNPLKLAAGLASGLNIYEHTAAREFLGNTVVTDGATITASKIIMATHFPIINKHGGYFLKMHQERSYVIALENAPDVDGMYLDEAKDGLSFRNYGGLLLIGTGGHRTGKQGRGWTELESFAKTHYPDAREVCRWATQDCVTLDGMPYIGRYSSRTPGLYVATGFNKWGMTTSMAAAQVLSDLVRGRSNPWEKLFSPSRTILRPQLLANGLESAMNLLKPTGPRCPHLGCALKWNPRERSWDCPCHGSRFDAGGRLLDNPATGNLKDPP